MSEAIASLSVHVNPYLEYPGVIKFQNGQDCNYYTQFITKGKGFHLYLNDLSTYVSCNKGETDKIQSKAMTCPFTFVWVSHENFAH